MIPALPEVAFGAGYAAQVGLPFGCAVIRGVVREAVRGAVLDGVAHGPPVGSSVARERIAAFDLQFEQHGHKCPLSHQLRRFEARGPTSSDPLVNALLVCELTSGLLMGVQDLGAIRGGIRLDVAAAGDTFAGARGAIGCRDGEPVVCDGEGIVASYFQGPDLRTSLTPASTDLVLFVFSAPGIDRSALVDALAGASRWFAPPGVGTTFVGRVSDPHRTAAAEPTTPSGAFT
ncbi:MAG: hypothetical protein ABMB14_19600 [Myxococcota bacterium]